MKKLIYSGKTKDVYQLDNGNCLLKFKDDVTGENGVFDPGANAVGLIIDGAGRACLRLSVMFFEILQAKGIPTHYISADIDDAAMTVKPATVFGKGGIEVICRYRAAGSFLRRFGSYISEGDPLDAFVETTIKDDARQDPPICGSALAMLGILTRDEHSVITDLAKKTAAIVKETLAAKGLDLYDIKFEFGRVGPDNGIALIDEISGGNMRVCKNGEYIEPLAMTEMILS
ncbi:MAG: hypothetical protein LBU70_11300 [Chitinispirillales bacterium]|jgi:phosphoribosylaminoimidazole-succinocarboxamide synthase|nr:hypothetical protein [Chitinispirillales bacterium]